MEIKFNKPYLTGKETHYIYDAVHSGKLSGNGKYTKKCQEYFENKYGFKKTLLTTSCTDALEMCAILADIKTGDEVIVPSFTFVSTAIAFIRQGATIRFADSYDDNPNIDPSKIESLINENTKAIVPVHYAGVACDMDAIIEIAKKHNLLVIEDAAQAIDSFYINSKGENRALGSIGHMSAFSFHETKNIISGEGGLLAINDERFIHRAEIIWEKGTNRAEFFRGEVNKYGWVDTGSSFLPSELIAAFLWAQLENLELIQNRRIAIWNSYFEGLKDWAKSHKVSLPNIPSYATNNAHMFYLVCESLEQRSNLIQHLKGNGISAVFHYQSLHKSEYYLKEHPDQTLINTERLSDCLVRLPMYFELTDEDVSNIIKSILDCKL